MGKQIHFVFIVQYDEIVAYRGILAVYWEYMTKQIQKGPAEDREGQEESNRDI
jgi:hypothetical protein